MPPTRQELSLLISPLVPESLTHNTRVLSEVRSVSSLIIGISAGILGLESQWGFLYYFVSQLFVSALVYWGLAHGEAGLYFAGAGVKEEKGKVNGKEREGAWREIWLGSGLFEGLSGFVLGWAGVGAVIR
ncbi:hypothetical protein DV737_g3406, partial [Chaetothyriales sp. CBS 132003]